MKNIDTSFWEDPRIDCACDRFACRDLAEEEREIFDHEGKFKAFCYALSASCRRNLGHTFDLSAQ